MVRGYVRLFYEKEMSYWPICDNIVTDFSFALLNSITLSFNHMSLIEYLNLTYDWITKKDTNFGKPARI